MEEGLKQTVLSDIEAITLEIIAHMRDKEWMLEHGYDLRLRLSTNYSILNNELARSEVFKAKAVAEYKSLKGCSHADAVRYFSTTPEGEDCAVLYRAVESIKETLESLKSKMWSLKNS